MSGKTNLDTPQVNSVEKYKKVLEGLRDPVIRNRVAEILRNHSRKEYLKRLQTCGVIFK